MCKEMNVMKRCLNAARWCLLLCVISTSLTLNAQQEAVKRKPSPAPTASKSPVSKSTANSPTKAKPKQVAAKSVKKTNHKIAKPHPPFNPADLKSGDLNSATVLVLDQSEGRPIFSKNIDHVTPIASITKLMTAMVVIDAGLSNQDMITISEADKDQIKSTTSRLSVGTTLSRRELLHLALMSSENRAASALTRAYPGGRAAFISAMNQKTLELNMLHTRFVDGTGLSRENVSTAQDLSKMVAAAYQYPLIREFTTENALTVRLYNGREAKYRNSNQLVTQQEWHIGLSKTGYTNEAGRCLVMQTKMAGKSLIIVLLDAAGKSTRINDAIRIKQWVETRGTESAAG